MEGLLSRLLLGLAENSVKGTALLLGLSLLGLLLFKASANLKHLLKALGLAGVLILPALAVLLPSWQIRGLILPSFSSAFYPAINPDFLLSSKKSAGIPGFFSPELIVLIWLLGIGFVAGWLLFMAARLSRLEHSARIIATGEWLASLDTLKQQLGIRRKVKLLKSPHHLSPMTWGLWQPRILLPADAEHWSLEQRRIILLHELAHIRRFDWLWQILGLLACTLNWYNPLVWLASKTLRLESERAADDLVLRSGTKASSYAATLLHFSKNHSQVLPTGLAMVRQSQLGSRISAILASRQRSSSPLILVMVAIVALASAALLASLNVKAQTLPGEQLLFHFSWYDPLWGSEVEGYGRGIEITHDLRSVAQFGPNGFFILEDTSAQKRYILMNHRGRLSESFTIAGRPEAMGRAWLQDILPLIFSSLEQSRSYQQVVYSDDSVILMLRAPGLTFQLLSSAKARAPDLSPIRLKSWLLNL